MLTVYPTKCTRGIVGAIFFTNKIKRAGYFLNNNGPFVKLIKYFEWVYTKEFIDSSYLCPLVNLLRNIFALAHMMRMIDHVTIFVKTLRQ